MDFSSGFCLSFYHSCIRNLFNYITPKLAQKGPDLLSFKRSHEKTDTIFLAPQERRFELAESRQEEKLIKAANTEIIAFLSGAVARSIHTFNIALPGNKQTVNTYTRNRSRSVHRASVSHGFQLGCTWTAAFRLVPCLLAA